MPTIPSTEFSFTRAGSGCWTAHYNTSPPTPLADCYISEKLGHILLRSKASKDRHVVIPLTENELYSPEVRAWLSDEVYKTKAHYDLGPGVHTLKKVRKARDENISALETFAEQIASLLLSNPLAHEPNFFYYLDLALRSHHHMLRIKRDGHQGNDLTLSALY